MVVSAHLEASKIGVEILKQGGSAIDAAIAVEFALAVCYPAAGNIGGGGFMLIRQSDGNVSTLDYREKAPQLAQRDMYLDSIGEIIPYKSLYSSQAVGVPGTVDGMIKAHEKFGTLDFSELIQPAINLAKNGFRITAKQAESFNYIQELLEKYNTYKTTFQKDTAWKENDVLVQKYLAKTLELIRDKGREGFYAGATADKIVSEMQKSDGLISHNDLKNYSSVWRKPIMTDYKAYKTFSMAPPSSGGIALSQLLGMVENFDVSKMGFHSAESIHLFTEAERRVYADRAEFLGDPDFTFVPAEGLLQKQYIEYRMQDFDPKKASESININHGQAFSESEETTHYSIVDKWRNAVSATTTLNRSYGSKIIVEGAGFFLNNEMDDFSAKPGIPNSYGLVGGEANSIEANKRMLSSMTPTILEKDNELFMVLGSPGGSTIITSVFQTIMNVAEFEMTMQEAVSAKRFHHQWLPDVIYFEEGAIDSSRIFHLEKMQHKLQKRLPIGRVDAILVLPDNNLEGGADPRGDDVAVGY
ncbi:MAG: gamma-glutamyltransferase [Bacteroidetes bacterium]|jgi:gamma-glutamyltranspeptidase/glutathione hydrolase|nr:gamma-glutamyltransferase [Bacteroidota bacterium]MBT6687612.1 gamma-glutamyltransferase [Bacteroidota bacterium]MBT7144755.1 gamma-glutamyltransferase [Bacteroidota bacterium]MBT7491757.1 gamma-glutamyltransferase [Bacteroidota bacterium]